MQTGQCGSQPVLLGGSPLKEAFDVTHGGVASLEGWSIGCSRSAPSGAGCRFEAAGAL